MSNYNSQMTSNHRQKQILVWYYSESLKNPPIHSKQGIIIGVRSYDSASWKSSSPRNNRIYCIAYTLYSIRSTSNTRVRIRVFYFKLEGFRSNAEPECCIFMSICKYQAKAIKFYILMCFLSLDETASSWSFYSPDLDQATKIYSFMIADSEFSRENLRREQIWLR